MYYLLTLSIEHYRGLERMVLLRCFRPDSIVDAVRDFVIEELGEEFAAAPTFDLAYSFAESDKFKPLIIMLSPGTDPLAAIAAFDPGEENRPRSTEVLSLGQGQGPTAERVVLKAAECGGWVVLQNCHLAEKWMVRLANIWEEEILASGAKVSRLFRLWLTCYSTEAFPASLLQYGVKISIESPKGLKANLSLAYSAAPLTDDKWYGLTGAGGEKHRLAFRRLVFGLCYFHGAVLERLHFGPVGWNAHSDYDFDKSDLNVSLRQLRDLLFDLKADSLPFEALHYLTAECNYGGRVVDKHDRLLLLTLLRTFYSEKTAAEKGLPLITDPDDRRDASVKCYKIPDDVSLSHCQAHIAGLAPVTRPQALGLNDNAAVAKNAEDSRRLLSGVLLAQPQATALRRLRRGPEAVSADESKFIDEDLTAQAVLTKVKNDLLAKIPQDFDLDAVFEAFPVTYEDSINMTLTLEVGRYNLLLSRIRESLRTLVSALSGEIIMSAAAEATFSAIMKNEIPSSWLEFSYPSLCSMRSYLRDLRERVAFFRQWVNKGRRPDEFWLSGFFFPQSLLTSVLQNFSRSRGRKTTVEMVDFCFRPLYRDEKQKSYRAAGRKTLSAAEIREEGGLVIYGISLESARWNPDTESLDESERNVHREQMPPIWLQPYLKEEGNPEEKEGRFYYNCPVFPNQRK